MLVPVVVLGLAGVWRALDPGMAGWELGGDALLDSVRGSGPVAAGVAAWLVVRSERSGLCRLERLGHRSAATGPLTRIAVAAAAATAGYALTAGAVAAWIGGHGAAPPSMQAQEAAVGAAALLLHVTAGFLVALVCCRRRRTALRYPGRHIDAWVPAAVLAAGWAAAAWSGTGWPAGAHWPALLASPDVHHSAFAQWRPGLFGAALTWFCGLVAAFVLTSCWVLTRRRRYAIAVAAASVVAGVGVGQLRCDAAHPVTAVPAIAVCRTWPLKVCVNPAFAAALPQLETAFTAVAVEVSGTGAAVRSVTQLPPGTHVVPVPGGYGFHLDNLAPGYALRAESDVARQVAAALSRLSGGGAHPAAVIDHRPGLARSRAVPPACRSQVPYALEDGLELAHMCAQGARHLRPGRAQAP